MPRTGPLGSPEMKAKAKAKKAENEAYERITRSIKALKILSGIATDAEFAQRLCMSYGRYRTILQNPMSLRLREMRTILSLAQQYGTTVYLGIDMEGAS